MADFFRNQYAMGTRFDLVLPGTDDETGDFIFSLVSREIYRQTELLDNFSPASVISKINSTEHKNPFLLDNEIRVVFRTVGNAAKNLRVF